MLTRILLSCKIGAMFLYYCFLYLMFHIFFTAYKDGIADNRSAKVCRPMTSQGGHSYGCVLLFHIVAPYYTLNKS